MEVTSANMNEIKTVCWRAAELLKDKHSYAHFVQNSIHFLNSLERGLRAGRLSDCSQ